MTNMQDKWTETLQSISIALDMLKLTDPPDNWDTCEQIQTINEALWNVLETAEDTV